MVYGNSWRKRSEMSETPKPPTQTPKVRTTPADVLEGDLAQQHPADAPFVLKLLMDLKEGFGSIDERTRDLRGDVAGLRGDIKDLREGDIRDLRGRVDSKVSAGAFWAGVGILIGVVTLGVAIVAWLMPNPFGG